MIKEWQKLLTDGIYYSYESMIFYKAFYAGLGMDDIRELPSSFNEFLHRIVDLNSFTLRNRVTAGCVGRYRDEPEADEASFDFQGYFVDLVAVEINVVNNEFFLVNYKSYSRASKALYTASKAHLQQRRKSDNSPYIHHLIEVMNLLSNVGNVGDEDIIVAAILHDIIEDTKITEHELKINFGSRVASIVSALSDDKTQTLLNRRELILQKLNNAPRSVKIIKLADACSNVSSIPASWAEDRIAEYLIWLDQVALECRDANEALYQEYLKRRSE